MPNNQNTYGQQQMPPQGLKNNATKEALNDEDMKQTTINDHMLINIRRCILFLLLCVLWTGGAAKTTQIDSLSAKVAALECEVNAERRDVTILQKEVEIFEKSLRCVDEHVDRANEEISNQISASSHTIQVWGWVIAVIAIVVTIIMSVLGVHYARYINKLRKNIASLSSEAKRKFQQTKEVSKEMEEKQQKIMTQQQDIQAILSTTEDKIKELQELYSNIQTNSRKIYLNLRREETLALLTRLEEVPEDIANISEILLARNLEEDDFLHLLNAYHNLIARCFEISDVSTIEELREKQYKFVSLEESYALLFAQHFMGKAIVDTELRELLQPRFASFFDECFFRNDAEKSTKDLKQGINALEQALQIDILTDYIDAISKSQYSKLVELYNILLCDFSENQLMEVWDAVTKKNSGAKFFAETMKDILSKLNTGEELMKDITNYINQGTPGAGEHEGS